MTVALICMEQRKCNLGWVRLNESDYKLTIKEGCLVVHLRGKPRDELSLSLDELAGNVLAAGRKHVSAKKKQIDHPEFKW